MQTQTLTWHFTCSSASVTNTGWLMEVPNLAQGGDKQPIAALKPFLHDLERALYMEIDLGLLLAQLDLIWPNSSVKTPLSAYIHMCNLNSNNQGWHWKYMQLENPSYSLLQEKWTPTFPLEFSFLEGLLPQMEPWCFQSTCKAKLTG